MTVEITVLGMVQGIGFRPFVARLAEQLGVAGTVCNSGGVVKIIASATAEAVDIFVHRLRSQCPPGAQIFDVRQTSVSNRNFADFCIVESEDALTGLPVLPADLPVCEACLKEMSDPSNRRHLYAFISCTACGPRYSIMERLPYDRHTTTMDDFPMCDACAQEYAGDDRRRHAQTISCHDCGPQLILQEGTVRLGADEALARAIVLLLKGKILAVKGVGGYQFACSPYSEETVRRLRLLKRREEKPFAVMFPALDAVKEHCVVDAKEEALLLSPARPIVLLQKKNDPFAGNVSGESRTIGAFLPYTPLHQLLLDACGPLIMTSANLSSEPIITEDADALSLESPHLEGVLYNTRRITTPLDDSVARVVCGNPQLIRRSRGYVPLPIMLAHHAKSPLLAMGGDLKACFCFAAKDHAYLSQYFGDLEEHQTFLSYKNNINHMGRMLGLRPRAVACDLHPAYHSTACAHALCSEADIPLFQVQHHHAHIASVMAEHNLSGCIGVAFDGTGYGTDGTVWGGEFLLCRGAEFERVGHLDPLALLGGDQNTKDAEANALCHLHACGLSSDDRRFPLIRAALDAHANTLNSTSMGRLFDTVSALLGLKCYNSYEGECAIALENAALSAVQNHTAPYPLSFEIKRLAEKCVASRLPLIRSLIEAQASKEALALGFHDAVADMVLTMCEQIRAETRENRVALSGGVFANRLLTERCVSLLGVAGFSVYLNSSVPCNDGGIALGQVFVALSQES